MMGKKGKIAMFRAESVKPAEFVKRLADEERLVGLATVHVAFEKGCAHVLCDYAGKVVIDGLCDAFAAGGMELAEYIMQHERQ